MKLNGIVYCHWLWIWSLLFILNFIKYSPLFSLIIAFFITISNFSINKLYKKINANIKTAIVSFEGLILLFVFYKSSYILISDILVNALLFFIYLIFLHLKNISFFELYLKIIPEKLINYKSLSEYINKRFIKNL